MAPVPLPRSFFERGTVAVARDLLGRILVHDDGGVRRAGRIVETEAYLGPRDRACHTARGRTPRNAAMFGDAGRAYVYLVYGLHHCCNVVTEGGGAGTAVLLRALEPLEGCRSRTSGPGLLCRALGITLARNGADLLASPLRIEDDGAPPPRRVRAARRIGVDYAGPWARRRLRFLDPASPFVSRP
ncbi:MAG: DNA-3-methyladenine glycosylase [Planctomycetes bacterium]|nr:DNA-3-methyladenine glycosylase [Planctomycetota bacterium]